MSTKVMRSPNVLATQARGGHTLSQLARAPFATLAAWRRKREMIRTLERMDRRMLADIGVEPADIVDLADSLSRR